MTQRNILDDYDLLENIGKGTYGIVKRARHKLNGKIVAIKIMEPMYLLDFKDDIEMEFKIHASLLHLNIVQIYNYFVSDKIAYGILELCSISLNIYLEKWKITPNESIVIFNQICDAVKYMHSLGFSHHDIKPPNIIGCDDNWKLIDFGFSTDLDERSDSILGSYPYMPPEVFLISDDNTSYRSKPVDVWSLGVLFYNMLTGSFPYLRRPIPYNKETYENAILHGDIESNINTLEMKFPHIGDLLRGMLYKNAKMRLDMDIVVKHPVFSVSTTYYTLLDLSDKTTAKGTGWSLNPNIYHNASVDIIGPPAINIFVMGIVDGAFTKLTPVIGGDAETIRRCMDELSLKLKPGQKLIGEFTGEIITQ